MPVACSHRPQASDTPGSPAARRLASARPGTRSPPRSCPAPPSRTPPPRTRTPRTPQVQSRGQLVQVAHRVDLRPRTPPSSRSGVSAPITPSSSTPAVCTTPVSGCPAGTDASSAATASRSATSQAATDTVAPSLGQLGNQFPRPLGVRTPPAGQHQVPHAVLGDQVPGDHGAQRPGTARDQDRPVGSEHRRRTVGLDGIRGTSRAARRGTDSALPADRDLRLTGGQHGTQRPAPRQRRTSRGRASTRTIRSGFSAWAARTRPQTAAPAGSVTSPSPPAGTAPRVTTTSRDSCQARPRPATPAPPPAPGEARARARPRRHRRRRPAPRPTARHRPRRRRAAATSSAVASGTHDGRLGDPGPAGSRVHSTRNSESRLSPAAAVPNCSADTARDTSESMRQRPGHRPRRPPAATRRPGRRARPAPAAPKRPPRAGPGRSTRTAGTALPAPRPPRPRAAPNILVCRAASSSAGWMPNRPAFSRCSSGRATSAKSSSPRRHTAAQALERRPYPYPRAARSRRSRRHRATGCAPAGGQAAKSNAGVVPPARRRSTAAPVACRVQPSARCRRRRPRAGSRRPRCASRSRPATDGDLNPDATVLGHHQRRLDDQLLQRAAPDLVARPHRQLHQAGARNQHDPAHDVVRQPRMRAKRQPRGADQPVRLRQPDHRAEQRVAGGCLAQRRRIGRRGSPQPVMLVVERVRRQVDLPGPGTRRQHATQSTATPRTNSSAAAASRACTSGRPSRRAATQAAPSPADSSTTLDNAAPGPSSTNSASPPPATADRSRRQSAPDGGHARPSTAGR